MWLTRLLGPLLLVATTAEGLNSCLTDDRCARGVTDLSLNICNLLDADIPDLEACFDRIGRSNIQSMNFANNELRRVPVDFFEGFGSLLTLNLAANRLFIEANIFKGATALEVLNLADNNMSSLPTGAFEGLASLRELNLVDNNLRLQSGTFKGASSVEILHFGFNDHETLSAGIFEGLTSLRELDLSSNSLESLSAEGLEGLPSLTVLTLDDNNLPTVEPGTFVGSPALEILDLSRNDLETLTSEVFDGVRGSLAQLELDFNDLETLPANIFNSLATLRILRLNSNDLVTLPAGLFDGTPSLEELSLIDNEGLQCIPAIPDSVNVDLQLDADATCVCPAFPTCDENGNACDCQPGTDGYSCAASSSGLITAFECDFSALVDAGERTTVTVEASGLDARTSGFGCSPSGCTPENTRDNNLEANSRWSCSGNLVEGNGDCCIEYFFDEPQDIVKMNIAFARGTERTRLLSVFDNGDFHSQIEASGLTDDFEEFVLNTDETADLTLCLDDSRPDSEFLSITEVQFMVE